MRVVAVALPLLPFELASEGEVARRPRALVVADPPVEERTLGGGTRLERVSPEAWAEGVRPGQTLAAARAKVPDLALGVVRPAALAAAKRRLAEALLAFGATVAVDAGAEAGWDGEGRGFGDMVWVDVTGCAHLGLGTADRSGEVERDRERGEAVLVERIAARVKELGHACRVALADGPWLAAVWARHAPKSAGDASVLPSGRAPEAFAPLPVAALPLDAGARSLLAGLGLRTVADLRTLPRAALGARLGAGAEDALALAWGEDSRPLVAYVPEPCPEEALVFEHPVDDLGALAFVVPTLVERLLARLEGRGVAVASLSLGLVLDRAPGERTRPKRTLPIRLPAPSTRDDELVPVVRARLERARFENEVARAVMGLSLRADELVARSTATLPLLEPQAAARSAPALARVVGELEAELGAEAVGRLELVDALEPSRRTRLVAFDPREALAPARPAPRARLVGEALEPTRLFAEPRTLAGLSGPIRRHVLRLEGARWWARAAPPVPATVTATVTDYVLAWHDEQAAYVAVDRRAADVHGAADGSAADGRARGGRPVRIAWLGLYD